MHHAGIAILRILYQEHDQKRRDRRAGVDDKLLGI
jgi:hypothetical protein